MKPSKCDQNLKVQFDKNSNCGKNSKNSNCDKTQKLKWCLNSKRKL